MQWLTNNRPDLDLTPSNVRKDKEIFGVEWDFEGSGGAETIWKLFLANMSVALTPAAAGNNNEPIRWQDTIRFYDDWTYIRCFGFAWANQNNTTYMYITAGIARITKATWEYTLLSSIVDGEILFLTNIEYIVDWVNHRLVFDWPLSKRYYLQRTGSVLTLEIPISTSNPPGTVVSSSNTITYGGKTLSIASYHGWQEISTGWSYQVAYNMLPYISQL